MWWTHVRWCEFNYVCVCVSARSLETRAFLQQLQQFTSSRERALFVTPSIDKLDIYTRTMRHLRVARTVLADTRPLRGPYLINHTHEVDIQLLCIAPQPFFFLGAVVVEFIVSYIHNWMWPKYFRCDVVPLLYFDIYWFDTFNDGRRVLLWCPNRPRDR